jgi:YebC/PmpR family DNA-binding regulatory protein
MAGHSKFANIKHRKGAQDAKRAKLFTRIIKEITVAAKTSNDPGFNPRLRTAIITAKAANLPKDRITAAISKASSMSENYEEMRYEAYGPAGTAFIVETLTDNKNRTASAIRSTFSKFGGNLAEKGSVNFLFNHIGVITYKQEIADADEVFEVAVEAGAESVELEEELHIITTSIENFAKVRDALMEKYSDPESLGIEWIAENMLELDAAKQESITKIIDALEDDDDVQNIFTNANLDQE